MKAFRIVSEVSGVGTFKIEHPNPFGRMSDKHKPIFVGWNGCGIGDTSTLKEAKELAAKWAREYAQAKLEGQQLFLDQLKRAAKRDALIWQDRKPPLKKEGLKG